MKESYLKFYDAYTPTALMRFAWDGFFTGSNIRKLSLMNRQKDYRKLAERRDLLPLHAKLNRLLWEGIQGWKSHDYGEGYFYQGMEEIAVTGLRKTEARTGAMQLEKHLRGRRVLEIGCNTGFLSISIAQYAAQVTGFDINPHLVKIGVTVAEHLGRKNLGFTVSSFEDYMPGETFDAVLSFANHSTYDGNTRQPLEEYFRKCHSLTAQGGMFLFESHPPAHEGDGLDQVCGLIGSRFEIRERQVLNYGGFLDRGRTFIFAERRS